MIYHTSNIPALVLAGGINRIALFDDYTPGYKGLLPFRGKPLIQYTLDALGNTPSIDRICIIGPVQEIRKTISRDSSYEYLESEETLIENILKGLGYFRDSPVVLVIPSDLPLATPEAISDFLKACAGIDSGYSSSIFWSMVPESDFRGHYQEVQKGFNRFKDVSVCHGNLLLVTPELIRNRRFVARMDSIYHARKSSIRAALAVGPLTGLSYLIGVHLLKVLTMKRFGRIASAGFGLGLIPVLLHDPDIALDIDEARDYRFITGELDRREKAAAADLTLDRRPLYLKKK